MSSLSLVIGSTRELQRLTEQNYYRSECYTDAGTSDLHFSVKSVQAGILRAALFSGFSMGLRRTWQHIRESSCEVYVLWFPMKGSLSVTQDLVYDSEAKSGDFMITCADRPFHLRATADASGECCQLHVVVPSHLIRSHVPSIDRLCGRIFCAQRGPGRIAAHIYSSLITDGEQISKQCMKELGMVGLSATCDAVRQSTVSEPLRFDTKKANLERLLRFIDQHLPTQGLTAEQVAQGCNISRRYLHYLLRSNNTSFSEYLWQARLDQAHIWLSDREFQHFKIVDIAYMCGFQSASHFSNAYRSRFGFPPSDARGDLALAVSLGTNEPRGCAPARN